MACNTDANGDLTSCNGNTYAYDAQDHLTAVATPSGTVGYSYDPSGRLIGRSDNQGSTQYLYANPAAPLQLSATQTGSQIVIYDYDDQGRIVDYRTGSTITYVVTDPMGTPKQFATTSGTAMAAPARDPFGRQATRSPSPIAIGFAGGIEDPLTGLVTFGTRVYDPQEGRWLQPDPSLLAGGDPNLYRYAANDPIDFTDPTGLWFESWNSSDTAAVAILGVGALALGCALSVACGLALAALAPVEILQAAAGVGALGWAAGLFGFAPARLSQQAMNAINGLDAEAEAIRMYTYGDFRACPVGRIATPIAGYNPTGIRIPDIGIFYKGELVELVEVKSSATAAYSAFQQEADEWIYDTFQLWTSVVRIGPDGKVL
jgi:RHS repeat-associated protein